MDEARKDGVKDHPDPETQLMHDFSHRGLQALNLHS